MGYVTLNPVESLAATFERERGRLMALAYGFLGSHSDAEDIVQEAWLRYSGSASDIRQPEAWLTTVVSRIALDHLKSARQRRETYPGVWLPEPVASLPDPESTQSVRSMLSLGFLHMLETLSAEERAVVVLREGFERTYAEIAVVVGKSEQSCRQLLSRARRKLQQAQASKLVEVPATVVQKCIDALSTGDEQALLVLLADDAVLYGDGGGRVPSVLNPIYGAERIQRFFFGLLKKFGAQYRAQLVQANGQAAILAVVDGRASVVTLSFDGKYITAFHSISNPDKLKLFSDHSQTAKP
jgi:RNA polymerase sigma-70 factor, ECF subfamily